MASTNLSKMKILKTILLSENKKALESTGLHLEISGREEKEVTLFKEVLLKESSSNSVRRGKDLNHLSNKKLKV